MKRIYDLRFAIYALLALLCFNSGAQTMLTARGLATKKRAVSGGGGGGGGGGDITSGLVARWKFDEGTGTTAADATGNGHTGTLNGTAGWNTSTPKIGPAAVSYVSGTANCGTTFTAITTGTTFTFAEWVYPTVASTGIYQNLFTQGGSSGLWLHNGKIDYFSGSDHFSTTTLTLNTWHHIAFVVNAGVGTFYLDGNADGTASSVSSFNANGMGCDNGGTEVFTGYCDDARLYSRALGSADITTLVGFTGP